MDFKKLVMHDTDSKYQDMANGATTVPFNGTVAVANYGSYDGKRNGYYSRLDKEKKEFNNSISKIKQTRDARIRAENDLQATIRRDKGKFVACRVWTIIGLIVSVLIAFVAMKNGATVWAKEVLIPEAGFKYFFSFLDGGFEGYNNAGLEVAVVAGVLVLITWIVVFIYCAKEGELGTFAGLLFGGLFLGGLSLVLPFLAFRLILVGLSYVIYFVLTPVGLFVLSAIVVIILLCLGKRFELKRFKFKLFLNIVLCVGVSLGCLYFGSGYTKETQSYYDNHNGQSMSTAVEMESGKNYTAFIRETDSDEKGAYYFVFTPTKSGEYTFYSEKGNCTIGELYSSNGELITSNGGNSKNYETFYIRQELTANKTYYLKVSYGIDYYDDGHFQVYISNNNSWVRN